MDFIEEARLFDPHCVEFLDDEWPVSEKLLDIDWEALQNISDEIEQQSVLSDGRPEYEEVSPVICISTENIYRVLGKHDSATISAAGTCVSNCAWRSPSCMKSLTLYTASSRKIRASSLTWSKWPFQVLGVAKNPRPGPNLNRTYTALTQCQRSG